MAFFCISLLNGFTVRPPKIEPRPRVHAGVVFLHAAAEGHAAAGEYNGFHKSLPPWIFHAH